jgi:hypothetical protein
MFLVNVPQQLQAVPSSGCVKRKNHRVIALANSEMWIMQEAKVFEQTFQTYATVQKCIPDGLINNQGKKNC